MKLIDFFDRVYAINLPYRKDRCRMIVQELKKAGMPLKPNHVEIFPAIRPDDAGDFPSIGARGCFESHLTILKQAQADRLSNVLIVEDDLIISQGFRTEQAVLLDRLCRTDWGFVYFGHIEQVEKTGGVTLEPFSEPLITAHFYAVNGLILDRLVWFLEQVKRRPAGHPDGGPMHIDGAYSTFREQNPDIVTLIASPNLGWQQSSRSDISSNAWFDRLPVFTEMASVARIGKQLLKAGSFT